MVTGNNTIVTRSEFIDRSIEQLSASEGILSIFQREDGLSFCLSHQPSGKVILLADYGISNEPSAGIELLKQFDESFGSYRLGWYTPHYTWIPKVLFDESQVAELGRKTLGPVRTQWIEVPESEAVILHEAIPAQLERIAEQLESPLILPEGAIQALAMTRYWKTRPGSHIYVHVEEKYLSLTAVSTGKLLLQNHYPTKTDEDRLYFILQAYEQLHFHPDEVPLKLSGYLTESGPFRKTISKYIRDVNWLENLGTIHPAESVPAHELRKYAPLIHLHSCG